MEKKEAGPMAVLECNGLYKGYSSGFALEGLTFSVCEGRVLGLLGPNGSGKTTLIKIINGLVQPAGGSVSICGLRPGTGSKAQVSYMPERMSLPEWMRVGGLVKFYADFYRDFDSIRAREQLARLGIDEGRRVRQLSKGMRQKTQLVLCMSRRAKLYLLDEPFGGVDPASRDYILETIMSGRSDGSALVISTHIIADVEDMLDDVLFLGDGRVVLSGEAEALRRERGMSIDGLFREVFRC